MPGEPLLKVTGLGVSYREGAEVLADVSLTLERGAALVVTGEAGSGKSTLLLAAAGVIPKLIRPHAIRGSVELDGMRVADLGAPDLFRRVGVLMQSADEPFWEMGVEDLVAMPLENRAVPAPRIRERVSAVLRHLGIGHLLGRSVRSLSGGERRISALAAALVSEPELLVLDEPMCGLDPGARARVAGILRHLRASGLALLIAEQNVGWLEGLAERVHSLTAASGAGERAGAGRAAPAAPRAPASGPALLAASSVRSALRRGNGVPVVDSVSVAIREGEVAGLIGANGSGKTTLLRLFLGLAPFASGTVGIGGEDAAGWTVAQRAARLGYATQSLGRMFFLLSSRDEVTFSLTHGETGEGARKAHRDDALALLDRFGLAGRAEDSPFALSNREQLLLALACIEGAAPSVAILDEPHVAAYRSHQDAFQAFLERCRERGSAVLLVSHDLGLLERVTDRLLILGEGRIAFDGPTRQAWSSPAFAGLGWEPPRPSDLVAPANHGLA
jgi:energy-coupling factor transport system ATP-binding protein